MPYLVQAAFWVGVIGIVGYGLLPSNWGGWIAGWLVSKLPDAPEGEVA